MEVSETAEVVTFSRNLFAGHFFPEEDDKFLEKVRESVEEEERQAATAAETNAAREAIAAAEESWKAIDNQNAEVGAEVDKKVKLVPVPQEVQNPITIEDERSSKRTALDPEKQSLPPEFYHYYHGSNNDLGTLIEVSYQTILLFLFFPKTEFMWESL